jgi:thymidylate synthase
MSGSARERKRRAERMTTKMATKQMKLDDVEEQAENTTKRLAVRARVLAELYEHLDNVTKNAERNARDYEIRASEDDDSEYYKSEAESYRLQAAALKAIAIEISK